MKSILKIVVLVLTANFFFVSSVYGQLTGWEFSTTIAITENAGSAYTDYPIIVYINTAALIANGQMNPTGNDIRFATDCAGTMLIPYYIESGINTDSTKIWIRMPQILALNTNTIYFFSGNNLAPAGSNFAAVFPNAFFSAGNQTLSGVQNYDWFQVNTGDTIFVTPGSALQISASKILINGEIDADTAGYAGGTLGNNGSGPGGGQVAPGSPPNTFLDGAGGGGYGGMGGNGGYETGDVPGAGGGTYGTANGIGDINLGSGGGAAFDIPGGDGGGSVQFTGFDVDLNGTVSANGQDAPFADLQGSGGGAGGGILAIGQFLSVTGTISANGGAGNSPFFGAPFEDGGGGGGGGRVKAFYYSQGTFSGTASVTGGQAGCCGSGGSPQNGSDGTEYSSQLYGAFGIVVNPLALKQSPGITSGPDTACINSTETYVAGDAGGLNYYWNVVGGSVTSGQYTNTVQVTWSTAGTDSIEVVTTNSFTGCSDTTENAVLISNEFPVADFTYSAACTDRVTNFVDESTISVGTITSYNWNFGDGGTSTDRNPRSLYTASSIYSVTLTVTSALGCSNSKVEDVAVLNPPTANFSADNVCFGQPTGFTNLSSGATYLWYLGDGSTSTASSFAYTYSLPGTYTVSLVATNANGCSDSISEDVTVYPTPVANFEFTNACPGNAITFTNLSSVPSGTLTYNWSFGDGTGSTDASPSHAYAVAGTYSVTLIVTSANGCTATSSQPVTIFPVPVPSFTAPAVCNGTAVQFNNTTTVASGFAAYQWDFGDGTSSSDNNPSHLYTSPGIYTVSLIAQSNNGCIDSVSQLVQVYINPTASFISSADTICLGDSITFTNTSSNGANVDYVWDFGDGDTSHNISTAHTYSTAGTYTVTLLSINSVSGCADSSSQIIIVNQHPTAAFTADTVCQGNITQFINGSTITSGSLTYLWIFGDGTASTDINPSHTYATNGAFTVLLTVTSNNGCIDTVSHQVIVNVDPISQFSAVDSSVCDSVAVVFVDGSTVSVNTVYHWQFGDGDSSSSVSPSHIYAGPGTYTVTLTLIDTVTGCNASSSLVVTVFPKPNASFNDQNVCIGNPVQFNNTSTITSGTLSYVWNFGDSTGSIDVSPAHLYDSIGIKNITLIATSNNGCSDTVSNTVIIYPLPVASFSAGSMCFSKQVTFTNLTSIPFGTDTYLWNFGDGTTDTSTNPVHTFPALGVFNVTLTATSNEGCSNSVTMAVTINPNPTANFLGQNVCFGDSVQFTNLSSNSSGTFTSFWEFGDGFTSSAYQPAYFYTAAGTYNVTLVITSNSGCVDSITRPVTIYPLPSVAFVAPDVCIGFTTVFQNESQVTGGTISNTNWNFGDGQVSEQFSPTHLYAQPGSYNVSLEVISNQGCIDSLTKSVIVHNLPDDTIRALGPAAFCFGDSVALSAGITGQDFYLWSNGDTTQNITVNSGGLYHVTVTSEYGCADSDTITVTVWSLPKASAGNDTTISKGYIAYLHGSGGVTYYWTPDSNTLNNPNLQNPQATPLQTTTYTVLVTDTNGCKDTASVTVTVLDDYNVMIPNLFTPNNDGHNDFWVIINIETYPNCNVMVFDRMGDRVYEAEAYHNQWDGTFNGKALPDGTYYYVVTFDGIDKVYKGAVNILR